MINNIAKDHNSNTYRNLIREHEFITYRFETVSVYGFCFGMREVSDILKSKFEKDLSEITKDDLDIFIFEYELETGLPPINIF